MSLFNVGFPPLAIVGVVFAGLFYFIASRKRFLVRFAILVLVLIFLLLSCIRIGVPGYVGLIENFGRMTDHYIGEGVYSLNPFSQIKYMTIRDQFVSVEGEVPIQGADKSIHYQGNIKFSLNPQKAKSVYLKLGPSPEKWKEEVRTQVDKLFSQRIYRKNAELIAQNASFDNFVRAKIETLGFKVSSLDKIINVPRVETKVAKTSKTGKTLKEAAKEKLGQAKDFAYENKEAIATGITIATLIKLAGKFIPFVPAF